MSKNIIRTLIITTAAAAIMAVFIAIACGPAAPGSQGEQPTPEPSSSDGPTQTPKAGDPAPTLAGTPPMIYLHNARGTLQPVEAPPTKDPNATPPVLGPSLAALVAGHKTLQEQHEARGEQYDPPRPKVERIALRVIVESDDKADEVAKRVKKVDGAVRVINKDAQFVPAALLIWLHPSVLGQIANIDGVTKIERVDTGFDNSSKRQGTVPTPDLKQVHGVDQWHVADVRGQSARIGIIDSGFEGLNSDRLTTSGLCFIPGSEEPTNNVTDCEYGGDHGTRVVNILKLLAPRAFVFGTRYYISNPRDTEELKQAVDWMSPQVDVINHSRSHLWDGPGDGTSPFVGTDNYSPINSVKDAAANDTIWVNPAGNSGEKHMVLQQRHIRLGLRGFHRRR